ncbi:MAG TPA: D-2-hydroxyacid dehydrogenase [Paenalcaligenes sp.]|nr:D-2-hydroxyacid dehydrogenase [Paenalcaligenes sp.]
MKIVFLDANTLAPELEWPAFEFAHEYVAYPNTLPAQVAERIVDAEIVICNKVPISAADIATAKKLKHIAIPATGYNHIDIAACTAADITVSHVRDYAQDAVPEHCVALLFALSRSLIPYHQSVAAGRWQEAGLFSYFDYPIMQIQGATLGIIGAGTLGRAFAQRAEALGMQVLYAEHQGAAQVRPGYTAFEQVLATADVISLHCPLNEDTAHILNADTFALMAKKPLIINSSRGGLIDPEALVKALDLGQISGAAIDVVEEEPPAADHPYMHLMDRPNFILTPHVAWASQPAMRQLEKQAIENIHAFVAGRPINLVQD